MFLKGLFCSDDRNIERMSELYSSSDYHRMQHFISEGSWNAQEVLDHVAKDVHDAFGPSVLKCLAIDESGMAKKGKHSVGVSRQYCGSTGKIDNCQVGVYGYLCSGRMGSLVDARLFLPECWTNDPKRCDGAGIPIDCRQFKTKIELALEIVKHQRSMGVEFDFVSGDSLYGRNNLFRDSLEDAGEVYVADIPISQLIYLRKPKIYIPEKKSTHGKKPTMPKCKTKAVSVEALRKKIKSNEWKEITLRIGTKGLLKAHFYTQKVWTRNKTELKSREVTLIIRRDKTSKGNEYKYSFINVEQDEKITLQILAEMQAQRCWIEKGFKEAKSEVGMADYQIRGWLAWHHTMAMTIMALNFTFQQKIKHNKTIPLLSVKDVRDMLIYLYSGGIKTIDQMLEIIKNRHTKRKNDILLRLKKSIRKC